MSNVRLFAAVCVFDSILKALTVYFLVFETLEGKRTRDFKSCGEIM